MLAHLPRFQHPQMATSWLKAQAPVPSNYPGSERKLSGSARSQMRASGRRVAKCIGPFYGTA